MLAIIRAILARRSVVAVTAVAVSVVALLVGAAAPATAVVGGPVSTRPVTWTPHFPTSTAQIEQVRQLAECGATMYAVGTFTTIQRSGASFTRNNAFSFSATTGVVSSWNPSVNGTVNSIALSANCATAYLGGVFTSVHGTAAKNLASVSTATGAVNTGFGHNANGQVETLRMSGSHLLVGGFFTGVNGSTKRYMVSLQPTTGVDDGYVNLNISGNYVYTDDLGRTAHANPSRVYNLERSPDGTRLLVMGDFTSVAGQGRRQIFMLDLGATSATLDPWYSAEFNANCGIAQPYYVQAAAWSPNGASVYIGTTGNRPANGTGSTSTGPRAGLCDAASAFPSTKSSTLRHTWVNYTGCDSLFAVAADTNDVYVGGHERWANNPAGCGVAGPGAVARPGVGALAPSTGSATAWNPTRARGLGADDMLLTSNPAGLWIASDNYLNSDQCGGVSGLAGICFLPA